MSSISAKAVFFSYAENAPVLENVFLEIAAGERWALIGKNGTGKSTLIKTIGGLLKVRSGSIAIEGKPVSEYRPIDLARHIAYVPQAGGRAPPPFSVSEFVLLGRFPYHGFFAFPSAKDRRIVEEVLDLTDTGSLACRPMQSLSGGELQRVFLAAAVAQRTGILLLDEPMSFLDPLHQEMMYRSLTRIQGEYNTTVVTVTHDVNYAVNRCSHICALRERRVHFAGAGAKFRERALDLLEEIYSIPFSRISGENGRPAFYSTENS